MGDFKEWLSDNLRYFLVGVVVILIIGGSILGLKIYSSKVNGNSDPAVIRKNTEAQTETGKETETKKQTEKETKKQTEKETKKQTEKETKKEHIISIAPITNRTPGCSPRIRIERIHPNTLSKERITPLVEVFTYFCPNTLSRYGTTVQKTAR